MQIGQQVIKPEDMPSYMKPEQQPYHIFQSMQDSLEKALNQPILTGEKKNE